MPAFLAGRITVATNMAGRGTDIRPPEEVLNKGGLHMILTVSYMRLERALEQLRKVSIPLHVQHKTCRLFDGFHSFGTAPPRQIAMQLMRLNWMLVVTGCFPGFAFADLITHFSSVAAYVASLQGVKTVTGSYGDLTGSGHRDYAGVVKWKDEHGPAQQVFLLTQTETGDYVLGARTARQDPTFVGIGEIDIKKSSIFISSGFVTHGSEGEYTHQFKFYQGQWRLIGVKFAISCTHQDENGDFDDGANSILDRNLLTGQAIVRMKLLGTNKTSEHRLSTSLEVIPLEGAKIGEDLGWSYKFDAYRPC